jgi:hypothetical protein
VELAFLEGTLRKLDHEVSPLRLPNNFVSHAPSQVDDFIVDLPVWTNVHREFGWAWVDVIALLFAFCVHGIPPFVTINCK